jgi:hypothetical protein
LQAHEECLVSITSAPSYIITLGLDERIRVWERFQGHLLNTINLHHAHSNSIVMLTPSLLITAKPGKMRLHHGLFFSLSKIHTHFCTCLLEGKFSNIQFYGRDLQTGN